MRTLTAQQSVAVNGATAGTSGLTGSPAFHMRVQVKDSGGTWRDLTTYPGVDMVEAAEWGESTDDAGVAATITLIREQDSLSLAPLMQASPLNVAFTPGGSYNALVFVNRQVRIDLAIVAADMQPVSGDWVMFFHGYIDRVEPGSSDGKMTLECRDLMAAVTDAYIEEDRIYGLGRDGATRCGCRVWEPSRTYALGEYVVPSDGKADAAPYIYKATSVSGTGTSGAAEPSWPTTLTNTVTDNAGANQIVWTCTVAVTNSGEAIEDVVQAMLNNNMSSAPTLSTAVDGTVGWTLGWFKQPRQGLNQALRTLFNQAGWDFRYRWDGSNFVASGKKFTRSGASVNYTFGPADWKEIRSATVDLSTVRNVVRVIYSDASDLDANKTPRRYSYTASDSSSITKYGRRFMEVAESSTSVIDSASEATTLANAIRDDLKEPTMELALTLALGFPWVEIGDTYSFTTDSRTFSATQTLAVWSYRHTCRNGAMTTELTCRGSPGLGPELWGGLDGRVGPRHSYTSKIGTTGFELTASPTVGGARVSIATSDAVSGHTADPRAFPPEYEIHMSTSSSFTPSSATLKAVLQGSSVEVAELVPNTVYYYKAVQRIRNGSRMTLGLPSTEKSFTAGDAKSIHVAPTVSQAYFPYNGAFEHATAAIASSPPDHWSMQAGTWGSASDAYEGTDANGGRSIVLRQTATNPQVRSSYFPAQRGMTYSLACVYKTSGANAGAVSFDVKVYFYKDSAGTASGTLASRTHSITNASLGTWLLYTTTQQTVPSDSNFIKVELTKSAAASDYQCEVDSVWLYRDNAHSLVNEAWTAPSLSNSWVNYDSTNWATVGYFIDANSIVHLRGLVKDGTLNAKLFTLPSGYRPPKSETFSVPISGGTGHIDVESDGDVIIGSDCSATWTSICGVTFRIT